MLKFLRIAKGTEFHGILPAMLQEPSLPRRPEGLARGRIGVETGLPAPIRVPTRNRESRLSLIEHPHVGTELAQAIGRQLAAARRGLALWCSCRPAPVLLGVMVRAPPTDIPHRLPSEDSGVGPGRLPTCGATDSCKCGGNGCHGHGPAPRPP